MRYFASALAIRTRLRARFGEFLGSEFLGGEFLSKEFLGNERAVSAIEFALVLPFMVALLLGSIEISNAVSLSRKVTLTAHTVADLVTQYSCITSSQMTDILAASTAVVAPYSSANLVMSVTEVTTNANKVATVAWTTSGTIVVGSTVVLPTSLQQPNMTYIWGQAQNTYTPMLGYKLTGPIKIFDQIYLSPRLSPTITYSSTTC
jgi:Flp pilus assembly protein TadG